MSSTNRGAERQPHDLYPTPAPPIDALLSVMHIRPLMRFHEPCRGTGAIYDRIDCSSKSYCEITEGVDYLARVSHCRKPTRLSTCCALTFLAAKSAKHSGKPARQAMCWC